MVEQDVARDDAPFLADCPVCSGRTCAICDGTGVVEVPASVLAGYAR